MSELTVVAGRPNKPCGSHGHKKFGRLPGHPAGRENDRAIERALHSKYPSPTLRTSTHAQARGQRSVRHILTIKTHERITGGLP